MLISIKTVLPLKDTFKYFMSFKTRLFKKGALSLSLASLKGTHPLREEKREARDTKLPKKGLRSRSAIRPYYLSYLSRSDRSDSLVKTIHSILKLNTGINPNLKLNHKASVLSMIKSNISFTCIASASETKDVLSRACETNYHYVIDKANELKDEQLEAIESRATGLSKLAFSTTNKQIHKSDFESHYLSRSDRNALVRDSSLIKTKNKVQPFELSQILISQDPSLFLLNSYLFGIIII